MFNIDIIEILMVLPTLIIALPFHEFMHGWIANKLGDTTAKNSGRLTLNPLAHLDPIGAFLLLFAHFGWAKPVPVNPYNFKNPRTGMAIVGFGGPLANFLLAIIGTILRFLLDFGYYRVGFMQSNFFDVLYSLVYIFIIINVNLAIFNLIPIPPLDGSKILFAVLPDKAYFSIMRYERYGFIVLLVLLYVGSFSGFLTTVSGGVITGLSFVVENLFSLVGLRL